MKYLDGVTPKFWYTIRSNIKALWIPDIDSIVGFREFTFLFLGFHSSEAVEMRNGNFIHM